MPELPSRPLINPESETGKSILAPTPPKTEWTQQEEDLFLQAVEQHGRAYWLTLSSWLFVVFILLMKHRKRFWSHL